MARHNPKKATHPCYPRRRFATQDLAAVIARSMGARGKHRVPEACCKCNGWHLAEPHQSGNRGHL